LDVPDITCVTGQLTALESLSYGILVADSTTGSVDEPSSLLEVLEELCVDEATSTFVERTVDGDDVALGDELLKALNAASIHSLGSCVGQRCIVIVEEFFAVEGNETLKNTVSNTSSTDGAKNLALQVEGVPCNIGNLPVTAFDHLMGRDKVADEQKDAHDNMFGDGDNVGSGNLENLDPLVDSGIEINVIGTNASCDAKLEVLCLVNEFFGKVTRVERGGDQDFSVDDMLLEVAVFAFLVA